jgi:hypothetical protein
MGALSNLMMEASAHGATRIRFVVDLMDYDGTADLTQRWACTAMGLEIPHVAVGKTVEEALRELVKFLKATRG